MGKHHLVVSLRRVVILEPHPYILTLDQPLYLSPDGSRGAKPRWYTVISVVDGTHRNTEESPYAELTTLAPPWIYETPKQRPPLPPPRSSRSPTPRHRTPSRVQALCSSFLTSLRPQPQTQPNDFETFQPSAMNRTNEYAFF